MPSLDLLAAFFLAAAVFAYIPGPAMLYATAQTLARGRRAGWMAALGIHMGGYAHVLAAAFGLAFLFQAVPALYLLLKVGGALYLIWLGFQLWISKSEGLSELDQSGPQQSFWQSMTVEILNPKTALFYLAFLPQFTDPATALPLWAQLLILGTVVNFMFSSADVVCVVLADRMARFFRRSKSAGRWGQRIGGSLLIALGLRIVLDRT